MEDFIRETKFQYSGALNSLFENNQNGHSELHLYNIIPQNKEANILSRHLIKKK